MAPALNAATVLLLVTLFVNDFWPWFGALAAGVGLGVRQQNIEFVKTQVGTAA